VVIIPELFARTQGGLELSEITDGEDPYVRHREPLSAAWRSRISGLLRCARNDDLSKNLHLKWVKFFFFAAPGGGIFPTHQVPPSAVYFP